MNLRWHRSSAPFIGRIVGFAAVCSLVVAAIAYGYFSPDDQIDTSASATTSTTSQTTTTITDGSAGRPAVVAADDIKSIGPADAAESTSTTIASEASAGNTPKQQTTTTTTPPPVKPATSPPTTSAPKPGITQLVLIDARTGAALMPLSNGSVVRRDQFPNASLSVEAFATSVTESVVFSINGSPRRLEDMPPYELNGKTRWLQNPGSYSLSARAYSRDGAQGTVSSPFTIQLTVQ